MHKGKDLHPCKANGNHGGKGESQNLTQVQKGEESPGGEATCRARSTRKGDSLFTWKK